MKRGAVVFRPYLPQSTEHAHGVNRLGIPKRRLRVLVGGHGRPAGRCQPLSCYQLVEHREQKCDDTARKSKISEPRMEEERRGDEDWKPGRVTERNQSRSGQEFPNRYRHREDIEHGCPPAGANCRDGRR